MSIAEVLDIVRQAPPEELPAIEAELAAAHAMATARRQALPVAPVPVVTDPDAGPPYTPEEFAALLGLVDKDGKPQVSRVHNLVRRTYDPLPVVRFGRRALRIPRAKGNAWMRKQEGRRG